MAYFQRVWAQIDGEGNVTNRIIADDYETANVVTRDILGDDAIAVEISQWNVNIGDKYIDNIFYRENEDGEQVACEYIPDMEEAVDAVKYDNVTLKKVASFIAPSLTDEQAAQVPTIYPTWESYIGKELTSGTRVQYMGELFKASEDINPVEENDPPMTITEDPAAKAKTASAATPTSSEVATLSDVNVADVELDLPEDEIPYVVNYNSKYKVLHYAAQ